MLEDIAILTGGQHDRRGARPQAREGHAEGPRPREAHHDRQGQHDHRRRRRQEGRHRGAREDDPRPDRGDHLRLRPREAPGAAREARRRRGGHQRRRGHRDRDEGEEGPRRGRAPRDPRGGRGGHRPRRRRRATCAASRRSRASRSNEGEKFGVDIVRRALEEPLRQIAENAGHEGSIVVEQGEGGEGGELRLQRRHGRVRGPRQGRRHRPDQGVAARRSRTRRRSRRSCSRPRP